MTDQVIEPLNEDDSANVGAKREWVRGHYEPHAQHKYDSLEGKLTLLDAILVNGWVSASDTLELQCLGITFGDALAQKLGMHWVAVEDEFGRDPALQLPGTSIVTYPMTSIAKRVERGETVDVYDLFNDACATIASMARDGR